MDYYLILANLVALFHGLVVLPLIIFGPIVLLLSKKRIRWLENFFLYIGLPTTLSLVFTGACFLTVWEQDLRKMAGVSSYTGGFVRHYLGKAGVEFPDVATTIILTILISTGFIKLIWNWWQKRKS